jgi:hypothetical protein
MFKRIPNARDKAWELMDEGVVDPRVMAQMCLEYMSADDVKDMLLSNDLVAEEEED